jgi:hypothetical protein
MQIYYTVSRPTATKHCNRIQTRTHQKRKEVIASKVSSFSQTLDDSVLNTDQNTMSK